MLRRIDSELYEDIYEFEQKTQGVKSIDKLASIAPTFVKHEEKGFFSSGRLIVLATVDGRIFSNKPELNSTSKSVNQISASSLVRQLRQRVEENYGDLRIEIKPVRSEGKTLAVLLVAESLVPMQQTLQSLVRDLFLASLISLLLATIIGFIFSARSLSSLTKMANTAEKIDQLDLNLRINYSGVQDEIGRLANTFDRMLDRLESAFKEQRQFISNASHELRTPITIIKGHLQVLERLKETDSKEFHTTVRMLIDELNRMTRLVNNLLILARSERKDFLFLESLNLAEFLNEVFLKARSLGQRDWQIGSIPEVDLKADRDNLTQVFLNLFKNAVRFSKKGDVIALEAIKENGWVKISVKDSGCGIASKDLPKIFARFYRAESSRSRASHDGAGLGLSIAQAIVKAHGGKIKVASKVGKGSTFTVWLPVSSN